MFYSCKILWLNMWEYYRGDIHPSIYLPTYLPIYLSIYLSIYIYLYIYIANNL